MSRHTNALKGEVQVLGPDSSVVPSGRLRGNEHKEKHRRLHLKMRKNIPLKVTAWNRLSKEPVESLSMEILKTCLGMILCNLHQMNLP